MAAATVVMTVADLTENRTTAFNRPADLRYVYVVHDGFWGGIPYRAYQEVRGRHNEVFAGLAVRAVDHARIISDGLTQPATGEMVSGNYFTVLGAVPVVGRAFDEPDDAYEAEPVAVISYSLWQRRFAGKSDVVGKHVRLTPDGYGVTTEKGSIYTVVGVMPAGFTGMYPPWSQADFWVTARKRSADYVCFSDQLAKWVFVPVGRIRTGIPETRIYDWLGKTETLLRSSQRQPYRQWSLQTAKSPHVVLPLGASVRIVPERVNSALFAIAAILFLIGAFNLAGMLFARMLARQSEIALCAALGASRWRIAQAVFAETVALALAGGVGGFLGGRWVLAVFLSRVPARFGQWNLQALVPDATLTAFGLLVCVLSAVVVGVGPALAAVRRDVWSQLLGGSVLTSARTRGRLLYWVVVPQLALSLTLLISSGGLVETVIRQELEPLGYETANLVSAEFRLPADAFCRASSDAVFTARKRRARFTTTLLHRVRELGVTRASMSSAPPYSLYLTWVRGRSSSAEGLAPAHAERFVFQSTVSPGYFETMNIPLVRGRTFDSRDVTEDPGVVIVSESLAGMLWSARDPLAALLAYHEPESDAPVRWLQVVGVVADVRSPLSTGAAEPAVYSPMGLQAFGETLLARTEAPPGELIRRVGAVIQSTDPDVEISRIVSVAQIVDEMRYPRTVAAYALGCAGFWGGLLGAVGLYGVVAYSAAQRRRELGVRAALGARKHELVLSLASDGLKVIMIGVLVGCLLGIAGAKILAASVSGFPQPDALTVTTTALLVTIVVLTACYFPARTAAQVDPVRVLREP